MTASIGLRSSLTGSVCHLLPTLYTVREPSKLRDRDTRTSPDPSDRDPFRRVAIVADRHTIPMWLLGGGPAARHEIAAEVCWSP
jgi:hypothetical protein